MCLGYNWEQGVCETRLACGHILKGAWQDLVLGWDTGSRKELKENSCVLA